MKIILMLAVVFIYGCGLGLGDYAAQIGGDYYLADNGGGETMIVRKNTSGLDDIIIDARVDDFLSISNEIFVVARKPREIRENVNGVSSIYIDKCEYWIVNVFSNELGGPFDKLGDIDLLKQLDEKSKLNLEKFSCKK